VEADTADIAFADGAFTIAGTDRSMPIEQVAQMSFIPMGLPSELGVGLQGAGAFSSDVPMPATPERIWGTIRKRVGVTGAG
jgi:aerobic carbon-monoxide dehydrogenase large subunit